MAETRRSRSWTPDRGLVYHDACGKGSAHGRAGAIANEPCRVHRVGRVRGWTRPPLVSLSPRKDWCLNELVEQPSDFRLARVQQHS